MRLQLLAVSEVALGPLFLLWRATRAARTFLVHFLSRPCDPDPLSDCANREIGVDSEVLSRSRLQDHREPRLFELPLS